MESFLSGKYECDSTNQMEYEYFNNVSGYTANSQQTVTDISARNTPKVERSNPVPRQNKPQTNIPNSKGGNNTGLIYVKKQTEDDVATLSYVVDEKREMDEYDLYGQLLAKKLRKLDEHQRDVAMHDIDNIMFRAKMQSSTAQSRSYSSSPSPVPRKVKSPIFVVAQQPHPQYEDENTPYQDPMQPQPPS